MKIKKLPDDLVKKIAAGEVVERPSSVVKELVENSIDAEAARIAVQLGEPIYSEIGVSDDGVGMTREDALLSLERYSTSKLSGEPDLLSISTLGFRGEALPSIAQVSRLALVTRSAESLAGTVVRCVAGRVEEVSECGRAQGTTVGVRDLFFNTPVRRKFLRSRTTELRQVIRVVTSYALAFENIHFVLKEGDRELLNLPPAPALFDRVVALYGLQTAEQLEPLETERGGVRVRGFAGGPELSRASGEHQLFWVNRRWVGAPALTFAVRDAYSGILPRDRYPMCLVMLEVAPDAVDVNVHPTKREVKFAEEGLVRSVITAAVRDTLARRSRAALSGVVGAARAEYQVKPEESVVIADSAAEYDSRAPQLSLLGRDGTVGGGAAPVSAGVGGEEGAAMVPLWQLHRTYILAQIKGGLVIVDQHAAHERVLYEEARRVLAGGHGASQQLLFPLAVGLTADEFETLLDMEAQLRKLGFDMKASGKDSIVVKGIPAGLRTWREGQLLRDILDGVTKESAETVSADERLARSFACHAAVKAGDALTLQEMNHLVDKLFSTSMPQGDPHGRLTFLRVSLEELERRLGRS
ncbi:MAG: DNA mismatch repair endonuclease MutL [Candidatus Eisenbacteria bacterium]|nr:DNA mismatch repair endonuclease MutL [Candidatus Eisenbacteria bacterium]